MDINETLEIVRRLMRETRQLADLLDTFEEQGITVLDGRALADVQAAFRLAAETLADHTEALDGWLSRGGHLPAGWQR
jgi:hypothetical protein